MGPYNPPFESLKAISEKAPNAFSAYIRFCQDYPERNSDGWQAYNRYKQNHTFYSWSDFLGHVYRLESCGVLSFKIDAPSNVHIHLKTKHEASK